MENKTVTAAIRDKLVMDCVGKIAEITGGEENFAIHAALVLFVAEEITGLGDVDDLREQLSEITSRIVDKLTE